MQVLKNNNLEIALHKYGARILSIQAPDKNGVMADVVLGYDTPAEYRDAKIFHGSICGRVANRITNGQFEIDGWKYQVSQNKDGNCLHGGFKNLSAVDWSVSYQDETTVIFSYFSKHGEEGFPGNVHFNVTYTLEDASLKINLIAETDKPTPINLTSHPYFNLGGYDSGSILGHKIQLFANEIIPTNKSGLPTGKFMPVQGTAFDFREAKSISADINDSHEQIQNVKGYDHTFVIEGGNKQAFVVDPKSGRTLTVYSTMPGVQFYTANTMKYTGKGGRELKPYEAFCLEPQFFPDSPNQGHFPDTILRPGTIYNHDIVYELGVI